MREYRKVMRCLDATAIVCRIHSLVACLMMPFAFEAAGQAGVAKSEPTVLTNLSQLRLQSERELQGPRPFQIVAEVIDADRVNHVVVLHDSSGTEFLRFDFAQSDLSPGATVSLEGRGYAVQKDGFGLAIVPGTVVENDGLHQVMVESGTMFLNAGLHPISVEWFNRFGQLDLGVEYEGPNTPRQSIPGHVLSRIQTNRLTGETNFVSGLDYRCYEGGWESLPDFRQLEPVREGTATNISIHVRTRDESVGLEFTGFIRIEAAGYYTFHIASDDGSRLSVGIPELKVRVLGRGSAITAAQRIVPDNNVRSRGAWGLLEGVARSVGNWSSGGELQMRVENHDIRVEVFAHGTTAPSIGHDEKVHVTGYYEDILTPDGTPVPGRMLVLNWQAVCPAASSKGSSSEIEAAVHPAEPQSPGLVSDPIMPAVLKTAVEIKSLTRESAEKKLPVSIRGVVTAAGDKYQGAVIQDATSGVFVEMINLSGVRPLRRGDLAQIDGVTGAGWFAPVVTAQQVTRLGPGQLPQPLRATWDQLVNGTLDNEFVEIEGLVTGVRDRSLLLLTEGGQVAVELRGYEVGSLPRYQDALIRIRGCFGAGFDPQTRKLDAGSALISGATVDILQAPPQDAFDAPAKSIGELLLYDPKAALFRRLKVEGQVIHGKGGEYFLTDGSNALRVITRSSSDAKVGDLVEAVGFLKLGHHPIELEYAAMRKTGAAPLPEPKRLAPDDSLLAQDAGSFVRVEATLLNHWREGSEEVLELQSGLLAFRARSQGGRESVTVPADGSLLELTGVYSPQRLDGKVDSFNLLLASSGGIRVLSTPPWWNLQRVLVLSGVLAVLLCAALIWNKELQAKVEERGRLLETEIRNRQQAELKQAAEAERARIARDLHDDLGTGLTEVSLLASAGLGQFQDGQKIRDRFHSIAEKARSLVSGLDVIIWAIDPARNSLQSFADYLAGYAQELFSNSVIDCRLRVRVDCGGIPLGEAERHNLFLAAKEALNNVVRHASATEVELQISQSEGSLRIVIADNGRGFDPGKILRGHGLANLHERLASMQGQCLVESNPGRGTVIEFIVPLSPIHAPSESVKELGSTGELVS